MPILDLARLKSARKRLGLRQTEISNALQLADSLYGQWERGDREPTLGNLSRLARLLEVSMGWLLGEGPGGLVGGLGEQSAGYEPVLDSPQAVRRIATTAPGLRDLAEDDALCAALAITAEEWRMLASLVPPAPMGKQGYLAVLSVVRGQIQG